MLQKLAVIGLCLGSLAPAVGHAAPAEKPKAHSTLNLESTKKALESGDEARALAALDEIELSSDKRAAPLVEALLSGAPTANSCCARLASRARSLRHRRARRSRHT